LKLDLEYSTSFIDFVASAPLPIAPCNPETGFTLSGKATIRLPNADPEDAPLTPFATIKRSCEDAEGFTYFDIHAEILNWKYQVGWCGLNLLNVLDFVRL